ncbi:MAG: hypothetical protein Q8O40_15285 [Chloroflexota bacterium]|nr:hypothetical protein [Chloroflexota bacterium]
MLQATWIPEPLVRSLEAFKAAPPNELVKVTAKLSPPSGDVGEGAPISVKGKVTAFGLGVPMPVLIQMAQRPAEKLVPVAFTLSLPFSGDFSVELDTTGWAYGQYAFQAVALPLVGAPSWSPPMVKEVAEPRVGVSVSMALVGARSPLALAPGALGYTDYTLKNTGNVGIKNIKRLAFFQAGAGGTRWPADGNPITDAAILAGGASRRYDNHAVPSAGMAPSTPYDAVVYVQFNIDHVKLPGLYAADDRKVNELWVLAPYLTLIAAATTQAQLEVIRYGGVFGGVTVTGFEPDYGAGRINRDTYIMFFDAYVARGYAISQPPPTGIALVTGWNTVVYTGPAQSFNTAIASILPYLVIVYVLQEGIWVQVVSGDTMIPGATYSIRVTQNCLWTW